MILFLSSSFLRRVRLQWKSSLTAFLVGDRNLYFFYPDSLMEIAEVNPASIDSFLDQHGKESLQLLGFLTPAELPAIPGYAQLVTGDVYDPGSWKGILHFLGDSGEERRELEIKVSSES
jgi:hypothetical protein